ncbi:MAG: hypothetical protein KKD18_00595 [Nanoarchaeota archaeon]|nr:hypothetical protein [Nanoarchaeota archaeon]MBU0976896.1 hypothetical protein [Nanoarchaeota archaeon]
MKGAGKKPTWLWGSTAGAYDSPKRENVVYWDYPKIEGGEIVLPRKEERRLTKTHCYKTPLELTRIPLGSELHAFIGKQQTNKIVEILKALNKNLDIEPTLDFCTFRKDRARYNSSAGVSSLGIFGNLGIRLFATNSLHGKRGYAYGIAG